MLSKVLKAAAGATTLGTAGALDVISPRTRVEEDRLSFAQQRVTWHFRIVELKMRLS